MRSTSSPRPLQGFVRRVVIVITQLATLANLTKEGFRAFLANYAIRSRNR